MNNLNEEAQKEMFQAVYWYENGEYDLALNGDGNNFGLLAIVEDYGSTKASNLSNFYLGSTYLKQGQFETAIDYLEDFSSDDLLVQARAYSLIGDAYMELGNYSKAASQYGKAADYKSNKEFSPVYLMKQGLAYEKANDLEAAAGSYRKVVKEFSESKQEGEAQKYLSRLESQK
jgi:tetratricopeptide (TPR) repeat protein